MKMKRTVCLVLIFLLSQLLSSMVALFFFNLPNLLQASRLDVNVLAVSSTAVSVSLFLTGALVWAIMTLLHWTDWKGFRNRGLDWRVYLTVIAGMLPVIFLVNLLLELFSLEDVNRDIFSKLIYNPWGVLSLVLAGPFTEELVFRMGIQRHLMRHRMHPWVAITVTSLIFGIIHWNPAQIPGAIAFGMVLGWLYWRSGSFWISFAAHAMNNLTGVVLTRCTGNMDITMTDLCGEACPMAVWAIAALGLGYFAYRHLDHRFRMPDTGLAEMKKEKP